MKNAFQYYFYIVNWNDSIRGFEGSFAEKLCNILSFDYFPKLNTCYGNFKNQIMKTIREKNEGSELLDIESVKVREKLFHLTFKTLEIEQSFPHSISISPYDLDISDKISLIVKQELEFRKNGTSISVHEKLKSNDIELFLKPFIEYIVSNSDDELLYFDRNPIIHYLAYRKKESFDQKNKPIYDQYEKTLNYIENYCKQINKKIKFRFVTILKKNNYVEFESRINELKTNFKNTFQSYKYLELSQEIYINEFATIDDHPRILIINDFESLSLDSGLNFIFDDKNSSEKIIKTLMSFNNTIGNQIRAFVTSKHFKPYVVFTFG